MVQLSQAIPPTTMARAGILLDQKGELCICSDAADDMYNVVCTSCSLNAVAAPVADPKAGVKTAMVHCTGDLQVI